MSFNLLVYCYKISYISSRWKAGNLLLEISTLLLFSPTLFPAALLVLWLIADSHDHEAAGFKSGRRKLCLNRLDEFFNVRRLLAVSFRLVVDGSDGEIDIRFCGLPRLCRGGCVGFGGIPPPRLAFPRGLTFPDGALTA